MDIATIIGILAGFLCVIMSMFTGGDARMFFHIPSMAIVIGGTFSATLVHFSLTQVLKIFSVVKKTILIKMLSEQDLIQKIVNYSAVNRRDGALALEGQIATAGDEFLVKGLRMIVDGEPEENIERQMSLEIQYLRERHANGKKILEFMGASAPAFGMIGTLIGLVQMLSTLDNPDSIGAGMATALITTFYGALLANLLFIPLAGKLSTRSRREGLLCEMVIEGILGIVRGERPSTIGEKLQAFLSAKHREDLKPRI